MNAVYNQFVRHRKAIDERVDLRRSSYTPVDRIEHLEEAETAVRQNISFLEQKRDELRAQLRRRVDELRAFRDQVEPVEGMDELASSAQVRSLVYSGFYLQLNLLLEVRTIAYAMKTKSSFDLLIRIAFSSSVNNESSDTR